MNHVFYATLLWQPQVTKTVMCLKEASCVWAWPREPGDERVLYLLEEVLVFFPFSSETIWSRM